MIDGSSVLPVKELEAHGFRVLFVLEDGVDGEDTAKVIPDGG